MKTIYNDKNKLLSDWLEGIISDQMLQSIMSEKEYQQFVKIRSSFELLHQAENKKKVIWKRLQSKIEEQPRKAFSIRTNRFAKIAFSAAAAILIFFFGIRYFNTENYTVYQTADAQKQFFLLPDSSQVVLYGQSVLKFNKKKWNEKRNILFEGSAYFKVKKGSKFQVISKQGTVSVLGTQFEVNDLNNLYRVICFEGKVKVATVKQKSFVLTPGNGIAVSNNKIHKIKTQQTEPLKLNNLYSFEKQPIGLILRKMEKIYNVKFNTHNIDTTTIITGGIPADNLNYSLKSVLNPLNIDYEINGNNIKLTAKK
ncbi:MAG: FecR family protein [Chlorobi bacterium]|nr:FecR family protein [Chlorobiota bacterium]